jgi:hypothetical protein
MASLSMVSDEWKWLDSAAKATGLPWCGWPREWSKSNTACRTCISFYSRIQRGSDKTKQLEHIEKQKRLISKRTLMEEKSTIKPARCSVQKHIHNQYELQREQAAEGRGALVAREELKREGQYCTYCHSCGCGCARDREGYIRWYDYYDNNKYCMVCDSQRCGCTRTTDGHIIPKIVVKLIYEEEKGGCRIHKIDGCECPSSIKGVVTITHDGTDSIKHCTLHRDTKCNCGDTPKLFKIIKMIGYKYL